MLPLAAAAFWFSLTRRRCPLQSIYLGLTCLLVVACPVSPSASGLCAAAGSLCYRPVGMEIIPRNVKGINSPGKGM